MVDIGYLEWVINRDPPFGSDMLPLKYLTRPPSTSKGTQHGIEEDAQGPDVNSLVLVFGLVNGNGLQFWQQIVYIALLRLVQ